MSEPNTAEIEAVLLAATGVRFHAVDFLPMDPTALGMSYGCIDLAAESDLRRAGRWDGRRPAVALNRGFITRLAAERGEHPNRLALAVSIHESAHALDSEPPYYTHPAGSGERQARITRLALTLRPSGIVTAGRPWAGHGPRWWRLLFHIAWRVERLTGIELPAAMLSLGRYELPPPAVIRRAFGSEPRRFRRLNIKEIKRAAYPRKFQRLWASAVRQHVAAETRRARNQRGTEMSTFFEQLKQRLGSRPDQFADLAKRVADGDAIEPAEAEAVLSTCGKSVDDLQREVEALREKQRLQNVVRNAADLEKQKASIERKLRLLSEKQERELERLAEKHLGQSDKLENELADVQRQLSEANAAKRRLQRAAAERHSELSREVRRAEHRANEAWQLAYECQGQAAEDAAYDRRHKRLKQDAKAARNEADRLGQELATAVERDAMA